METRPAIAHRLPAMITCAAGLPLAALAERRTVRVGITEDDAGAGILERYEWDASLRDRLGKRHRRERRRLSELVAPDALQRDKRDSHGDQQGCGDSSPRREHGSRN